MGKYKFYSDYRVRDFMGADICDLRFPEPLSLLGFLEEIEKYDETAYIKVKSKRDYTTVYKNGVWAGWMPTDEYSKVIKRAESRHNGYWDEYLLEVEDE